MTLDAKEERQRICFVVSAPETANAFLMPHIEILSKTYNVDLVANCPEASALSSTHAACIHVAIERPIDPISDLRAVRQLVRVFRSQSYAAVHSVTPKAGLLAMIAARIVGVPRRIHWFTGQVWATRTGLSRSLLKNVDRFTAKLATDLLVDSSSQLAFLVNERVISPKRAQVLAQGSICGVDTDRFAPDPATRAATRAYLGIKDEDVVVTFIGRLNRDKGVLDLAAAMSRLPPEPQVWLIMAGSDEEGLVEKIQERLATANILLRYLGHVASVSRLLQATDIFCLPSYREGFGMSVIEAASCGIPAVASRIYGLTDAVVDGETGLLFPPGDIAALTDCLEQLIRNPQHRHELGIAARVRVCREFDQQILTTALMHHYRGAGLDS